MTVGRHLLSIADLEPATITGLIERGRALKSGAAPQRCLEGRTLGLIFQRPSNRTRVSFEVAIRQLGGFPISLFEYEVQLGQREAVRDVARILGSYLDGLIARLNYHRDLLAIAQHAGRPVINGLTDFSHPCQILADLLTIAEARSLSDTVVSYVGDADNNVAHSWLFAAARLGLRLQFVHPPGYGPGATVCQAAERLGPTTWRAGTSFETLEWETQVVYTDVWTSMGQEHEQALRREVFGSYQINETRLQTSFPRATVMHCLPAHRGEEITDQVLDGERSWVWRQAENRLHIQKAILEWVFGG
jgi:ornithine carbamoyltransferase